MRQLKSFMIILYAVGLLAGCRPETGKDEISATTTEADRQAIQKLIATNEAAYNNRDAIGVSETYALQGDNIAFSSRKSTGREAIRTMLETRWSQDFVKVQVSIDTIRFVDQDVAVAEIITRFGAGTGPHPRGTLVMLREEGKWLITCARFLPGEE